MKNLIVGQSGGPTSVINGSLAGIYESAKKQGFDKVYGMLNGIEGLLQDKMVDLDEYFQERLRRAPEQVIRWAHKGMPLQTSDSRPIRDIKVPFCELCGAPRVFEFQVLPTLLNFIVLSDSALQ